MEPIGSPISVFSFLNAVRNHRDIKYVEKCRQSLQNEDGENSYSFSDALKYAIMYGYKDYCDFLLSEHLEASLSQMVCCPLLLLAVRLEMPDIVEQLCKYSRLLPSHDGYINMPGCSAMECGRTALHVATETGNILCTKILLKYGARCDVKDDYGHSPVQRILYRLRSPHIYSRTILCLIELIKCQMSITKDELESFHSVLSGCIVRIKNMDPQWLDMIPGPFSLKQICRCVIRQAVMYSGLPEKLESFGLPLSLVKYLAMEEEKAYEKDLVIQKDYLIHLM